MSGKKTFHRFSAAVVTMLIAGSAVISSIPAVAVGQSAQVTWSSEDGVYKLADRPARPLAGSDSTAAAVTVNVDPGARYQTVFGQGQSLESSSVWNIAHLSPPKRDQLMRSLFDPVGGNAYNVVRLSMGCSDFCSEAFYTYDDMPLGQTDEALTRFSIQKDIDSGIVALARQARAINPDARFYLSMWSAPAWMKTNGSLIDGGSVKPEYYDELARYQRAAIEAYEAQGIPITAMTPQNEPRVITNYPTGEWTGEQMRDYIKNHLGPELQRGGLATEIWVGDDNPPRLKDFVPPILDDPASAQYVDGVAIHDYSRDDPTVLSEFALRYPGMPVHLSERSYYGVNGEVNRFDGQLQSGVRRVIDLYRNGLRSWTSWISFLDTTGEPNTGPLRGECCALPFTAPPGDLDAVTTNRDYYLYGQFSRYIRAGAVRIGSDQTSAEVSNVAFRNPDGTIVVVLANGASSARSVALVSPDGVLTDTVPAQTVATYRWAGTAPQSDPRLGTFRLVSRAEPQLTLHSTRELYRENPDALQTAASPISWNLLEQRWSITSAGDDYYRITSADSPSRVLHTTGENYLGKPSAWNVAAVAGSLNWNEQLWRIIPTNDGYYRLVNKARGTALQVTGEQYGYWPDVRQVAGSTPVASAAEQEFRLLR